MRYKSIQNGLVAIGAFIALACKIEAWLVFIFAALFWNYSDSDSD